jgi:hypothetical protein
MNLGRSFRRRWSPKTTNLAAIVLGLTVQTATVLEVIGPVLLLPAVIVLEVTVQTATVLEVIGPVLLLPAVIVLGVTFPHLLH